MRNADAFCCDWRIKGYPYVLISAQMNHHNYVLFEKKNNIYLHIRIWRPVNLNINFFFVCSLLTLCFLCLLLTTFIKHTFQTYIRPNKMSGLHWIQNSLTPWWFSWKNFQKKATKKKQTTKNHENYPAYIAVTLISPIFFVCFLRPLHISNFSSD